MIPKVSVITISVLYHNLLSDLTVVAESNDYCVSFTPLGDDWLEITPAQLDQMIYETQGVTKVSTLAM